MKMTFGGCVIFALICSLMFVIPAAADNIQTIINYSGQDPIGGRDGFNQFWNDQTGTWENAFIIYNPYGSVIEGTQYISNNSLGSGVIDTTIRYRTIFNLPDYIKNPYLNVSVHADNVATIYLNGHLIGSQEDAEIYSNFMGDPSFFDSTDRNLFGPGDNILVFDIYNFGSASSFDYKAIVNFSLAHKVTASVLNVGGYLEPVSGYVEPVYQIITDGESASIDITPTMGYHIASITDNGQNMPITSHYTIANVIENHNVVVTFAINTYHVTASVSGSGGTVNPATQPVDYNQIASIDITPRAGYHIASIIDNGQNMPITSPYIIANVKENHNVVVKFATGSVPVTVQLKDSNGNLLSRGTVVYFSSSGSHVFYFGTTSNGQVTKEMLPEPYTFGMIYALAIQNKSQDVTTNPNIVFQTGKVHSDSGGCTQYYFYTWRPFVQDMELLPVKYTFRYGRFPFLIPSYQRSFPFFIPSYQRTIVAGTVNHIP